MLKNWIVALCLVSSLTGAAGAGTPHDDCDAGFIAFLGADAYQFSPAHRGELGRVRLFSVLSYQGAAAAGDFGRAAWQLEIRGPVDQTGFGPAVRQAEGVVRIDTSGQALVEVFWEGRDGAGRSLPAGKYHYTVRARFLPDRLLATEKVTYDGLGRVAGAVEAYASTDEVVIAPELAPSGAAELRVSGAMSACQVQQNTPIESGFGYNFYYGSTHSHSNWSDGGQPTTGCSSGNAYGSGNFDPNAVYDYARNSGGVDYWLINEHNHLIADAVATNDPPSSGLKARQRYAAGRAAADAATVDDAFVGLYGMEWGVTTNADQGHVTLIETPVLFGWEPCSTCNGPNPECTLGGNCQFDVFTPKRFGYLTMYQRSLENPSPAGALGILCHPSTGQFDNYAHSAAADEALQGIAVRSGLAFNTAANCAEANVATSDYSARWRDALNRGFHLGPVADHDTHCNTYGAGIPNRTVYLLPNAAAPVLTKSALLAAHKARHFYATEDSNAQLVFTTGDGSHVMGDLFDAPGGVSLRAAVYDPNNDAVSTLEIWRGQIGGGVPASPYRTVANQATFTLTETLTAGTYYYYVHAVQADGHDLWSAPMWITYSPGECTDATAPSVAITAPAAGATITCADTTIQVSASDAAGISSVEVRIDAGAWSPATFNNTTGRWERAWASSTASSGAHTLEARATDASCGSNVGTAAPVAVTVANTACGLDLSGWRLQQRNSTATFTLPAGTRIPDHGYVVVGRDATQAQFEAFWGVLPAGVVYVNSAGAMPVINGSEDYRVVNAAGTVIDGYTVRMPSSANSTLQRRDPCVAAGTASNWTTTSASTATPGRGAAAGCAKGVVINEFADALGTGNFIYEFVELHYDR